LGDPGAYDRTMQFRNNEGVQVDYQVYTIMMSLNEAMMLLKPYQPNASLFSLIANSLRIIENLIFAVDEDEYIDDQKKNFKGLQGTEKKLMLDAAAFCEFAYAKHSALLKVLEKKGKTPITTVDDD